jgi:hypothetical protein
MQPPPPTTTTNDPRGGRGLAGSPLALETTKPALSRAFRDGPNRVLREPLAVGGSCGAVLDLEASRGERERSAHFAHSFDGQTGDPGAEQFLGDEREVVERERALLGHSVVCVEDDFSRDLSDRPGRGHCEERVEDRDGCLACEDEERTPSRVRMLDPPDLASGYQGSALIAARAPSNAHGSRSGAGARA